MINLTPEAYASTFEEISAGFSPLLEALKAAPKHDLATLYYPGNGVRSICKALGLETDVSGLYVFFKNGIPFYTGISGKIIQRIWQHVRGGDHFSASLCYRIGKEWYAQTGEGSHTGTRGNFDFKQHGVQAQGALKECQFGFVPLENGVELYLFEVYVALNLQTLHYNHFKTH